MTSVTPPFRGVTVSRPVRRDGVIIANQSRLKHTRCEECSRGDNRREACQMRKFAAGLLLGLVLGASASAFAAGVYGSGALLGWTVTKDGEEVCSDPDVNVDLREIECD